MRSQQIEAPIAERLIFPVKNAEATATIKAGTPLILNLSNTAQPSSVINGRGIGTEDGLQVVLPSTATAVLSQVGRYGVALGDILAGQVGESMLFGACYATVVLATRANTSGASSWPATTINSGGWAALSVDTVNNAFAVYTAQPTIDLGAKAILLDSKSMAASATTTADSSTVVTVKMRVFVRMM